MRKFIKIDVEEIAPYTHIRTYGEALIDINDIYSIRQSFTDGRTFVILKDREKICTKESVADLNDRLESIMKEKNY